MLFTSTFTFTLSCSGSHVVLLLVKKYPNIKVVCFDKLDYCSCLANLEELDPLPNYKFGTFYCLLSFSILYRLFYTNYEQFCLDNSQG